MTDRVAQSQKTARKPKMKRPGLPGMKFVTVTFGPRYGDQDPFYIDHLKEICNLSNGQRTIEEIARIIRYEIGPMDLDLMLAILEDLEGLGFLVFE